ncbi:MAG: spore coat associated protein CotJA [Eubacteriales bacterium]|nr:spore coat associated protein CotJA [Eubacteriales bacterium]
MSNMQNSGCECGVFSNRRVNEVYHHMAEADAPLAMGYVPYQNWNRTYDLCRALKTGTIFPCLDKPFCGKGGKCQ